jgi:curli biogenesis system outer membrane secretion channel CsgG
VVLKKNLRTVIGTLGVMMLACTAVQAKDDEPSGPTNYEPVVWDEYSGPKVGIGVLAFEDGIRDEHLFDHVYGVNKESDHAWPLGEGLANKMVSTLMATSRFDVVEKEIAEDIFDLYRVDVAKRIYINGKNSSLPKVPGVRYFITGSITDFVDSTGEKGGGIGFKGFRLGANEQSSSITMHMRVIDSYTGSVVYSKRIDGVAKISTKSIGFAGDNVGVGMSKTDDATEQAIQKLLDQAVTDVIALTS